MPTSSPAWMRPSLSLTSSAVAGPTVPRIAAGEVLGGGERQSVGDRPRSRDPAEVVEHLRGHVVAPVDDRLHERLRAGCLDLLDEALGIDVDELGEGGRGLCCLGALERALVDPDPQHRSLGHDRLVPGTEDVTALGLDGGLDEALAGLQRRLHQGGVPADQPGVTVIRLALGELRLGLVGPGLLAHLPAPRQLAGSGVTVRRTRCPRRRPPCPWPSVMAAYVLGRRGVALDEVDAAHVTGRQPLGQLVDGVFGVRTEAGHGACAQGEQQETGHGGDGPSHCGGTHAVIRP